MKRNRSVVLFGILLGLILTACAAGTAAQDKPTAQPQTVTAEVRPASPDLRRIDEQGAVTVTITPLNLDNPGETLDFNVVLDTHSIELDMDLSTLATLTMDTGRSVTPVAWTGPSGGHHVEGTLSFPATQDGESLLEGTTSLTLALQDVDVPERRFVWELGN